MSRPTPRPPAPSWEDAGDGADDDFMLIISSQSGVSTVPLQSNRTVVVGRDPSCDVVINDDSVSRRHATIISGNPLVIEDLGSTNGSFILGRQLQPGTRTELHLGSVAQLGLATVIVQRQRAPLSSSEPLPTAPPPGRAPRSASGGSRIVADPKMQNLYRTLSSIGPTTLSVLILGETGTGKEVFAAAVHEASRRAKEPFVKLNCGALPESLIESELFGHERGAFTGAVSAKPGLFEAANGGTVFLDEVGELTRPTQVKLLRVLETGEVLRIGSVRPMRVDVRLISATNQNLNQLVASSSFRMDLLFRINGFTVTLPPLRERVADIAPLARSFVESAARRSGVRAPELSLAALEALQSFSWPGNIRELRNVMERAVALCPPEERCIEEQHLLLPATERQSLSGLPVFSDEPSYGSETKRMAVPKPPFPEDERTQPRLRDSLQVFERERIEQTLDQCGGHQGRAAQLLGISRRTLFNKMEQLGIRRTRGDTVPPPSVPAPPPSSKKVTG